MMRLPLIIVVALGVSFSIFSQDSSYSSRESSSQYIDDYMTIKNILKECGISDSLLSLISKMEDGKIVFLDLSNRDVGQDGIKALPVIIGNLSALKTLIARDNVIETIPPEIFKLRQLKTLILSSNKIVSVPLEIGDCVNLDSLDLSHNEIESLPGELADCKNMTYLHLMGNKLTAMPLSIAKMPKLKDLHLKDNRLTNLPEGIMSMKSLAYIDFQNNILCNVSPKLEAWLKVKDKQYRSLQRCR
jgi:Leucine-rich repeat (LRR) protein